MRIMITLLDDERKALRILARRERREPREQAALIIRHELEQLGLLAIDAPAQIARHTDAARREGVEHANEN